MDWYRTDDTADIPSPALLLHRAGIGANLRRMLDMAGGPARLRPHIKTHKLPELVRLQVASGIRACKCATIAEAETAADNGADDILLAMQPTGPTIGRLARLAAAFPSARFAALVDTPEIVDALAAAAAVDRATEVFVDLDVGMGRTGIRPGPAAEALVRRILAAGSLRFRGLHAYDGHLGIPDPAVRASRCDEAFAPVAALVRTLRDSGVAVDEICLGGSPTFPIHARRTDPAIRLGPGTTVFWDAGYAAKLPDLPFEPAAMLLTRVVSKPTPDRLCLDLGHKAVASEMPHPRALFPDLPDVKAVMHGEEHLVVESPAAGRFDVGDILYALPWHICPTVALHAEVHVVVHGRVAARWTVAARARRLMY